MTEQDLVTRLRHPQFAVHPAHGTGFVSLATPQNVADMKEAADEIERLLAALKQFAELDPVEEYSGHRIVEMATDAINQQGTASNDKG